MLFGTFTDIFESLKEMKSEKRIGSKRTKML